MQYVPTVVAWFNLHSFTFCLWGKKYIHLLLMVILNEPRISLLKTLFYQCNT